MMMTMNVSEAISFCMDKGYNVMDLFASAMRDYKSNTVNKQVFVDCIKEIQSLWDAVKHLNLLHHEITARQLTNWFFFPDGIVTLDLKDSVIYERLYLLMCLNRDVSVSALLNSILDSAEYAETETWQEVE